MISTTNISPFCLLNGKMNTQLFTYTEEELSDFHKAIQPDMLSEVFDAVEEEYLIQQSPTSTSAAIAVADYLSILSPDQLEQFSSYLMKNIAVDGVESDSLKSDLKATLKSDVTDTYYSPTVELLEGYIAISSSNLKALDKFKERVIKTSDITWEHRVKKHGDVTIHSYVFNIKEDSK